MIYERHEFLTKWLTSLGVDGAVAAEDACRIEHVISKESFEAIKKAIIWMTDAFVFHTKVTSICYMP